MNRLFLDLARSTGWAAWQPGRAPAYGTQVFEHGFAGGYLAVAFHGWLTEKIERYSIDRIYYEEPIVPGAQKKRGALQTGNHQALSILRGMAWHTEFVARMTGGVAETVNVRSWRGHFCGASNLSTAKAKSEAVRRARELGFRPGTHDAAEAIGIMDYIANRDRLPPDWGSTPLEAAARAG